MLGKVQKINVHWHLEMGIAKLGEILVFCEITKGIKEGDEAFKTAISEGVLVYFQVAEKTSFYIVFLLFSLWEKVDLRYPYTVVYRFFPVSKAAWQDWR